LVHDVDLDQLTDASATPAIAQAWRIYREAQLVSDTSLDAAGLLWYTALIPWHLQLPPGDAATEAFGAAFAMSAGMDNSRPVTAGFFQEQASILGPLWTVPLTSIGPAAWSDGTLLALLQQLTALAREHWGHLLPGQFFTLVSAVLREAIGRGFPDPINALLSAISWLPGASEGNLYDLALLVQIAHSYEAVHLRPLVLAAIPTVWRYDEMAGLLGAAVVDWLVQNSGIDPGADPTTRLSEAAHLEPMPLS
jgi:hypothetical protein